MALRMFLASPLFPGSLRRWKDGRFIVKIITIVENTTKDAALKPKHGLCIYIKTLKHKVLFDLGPDDTYLYNAQKLGIDLAEIDAVVLSHGHKDHGGGLASFLKVNNKAKIFLHRQAFEPYYIKIWFAKIFIGLNKDLAGNERFVLVDDTMRIDDNLFLFADVDGHFDTKSNRVMLKKTPDGFTRDDFAHELNLIVTTEGQEALFSGCSHRGIANILNTAHKYRPAIHAVFGGFHLYNPATKATEPAEVAQRLAKELSAREAVFYTGHCTGTKAFKIMRGLMGGQLQYLSTGSMIEL